MRKIQLSRIELSCITDNEEHQRQMIDIFYNGNPLEFNVTSMWVPWKSVYKYGKHYTDLSFHDIEQCTSMARLFCIIYEIENYIMNIPSIPLGYKFIRSLKGDPKHKHPPRLRVRLGSIYLKPHTFVSGTIRCMGIWSSNHDDVFGCSWSFDDVTITPNNGPQATISSLNSNP